MVNLPRCITQGAPQVLRFQIGVIGQDLLAALPSGKERKDVLHTDPHTADAGPAATLIGVVGDALAPTDQDRYQRQPLMALDIVGPDGLALADAHEPLLSAIAAAAANTDRHGVPRRCFDAMAAAGLLGRPLTPPALQDRWLEPVACGQALAGVAFAHLRRAGAPNPLDGRLDWITSWDIADLVLLCLRCVDRAELADGQVLFVEDFSVWSEALELVMRSAQAAVIAHAGGAMHAGCAAERRLREASFLLVQAQSADSPRASLNLLLHSSFHQHGHQ